VSSVTTLQDLCNCLGIEKNQQEEDITTFKWLEITLDMACISKNAPSSSASHDPLNKRAVHSGFHPQLISKKVFSPLMTKRQGVGYRHRHQLKK
jgi:hypothetical protein